MIETPAQTRIAAMAAELALVSADGDAEMVDALDALERLKGAAAARQAEITAELDARRTVRGGARTEAGTGLEIGLARRESPHRGRAHLRLARALTRDLPHTLEALRRGDISERRAEIVATESGELTREQRLALDAELAPSLPGLGERETQHAARRIALRIDEGGYLRRRARALGARRVTHRILGDGMSLLSAVLPSETAGAVLATLGQAADLRRASDPDDDRTRTQVIADLAADRLLGSTFAASPPVAVKVLVDAETLLADGCEPGFVPGCGHVPASVVRSLVARGLTHTLSAAHRVFTHAGSLVAMGSDGRLFRGLLRDLVVDVRDQGVCRTPYCNAPAVHADHLEPHEAGGETSLTNGQGLCAGCNYAKQAPGFRHRGESAHDFSDTVEVTTPTGHRHRSHAPPLPAAPAA